MAKLNIGVIGLGQWGKNYIRLLIENPCVDNIYGCDIVKKNLDNTAIKYPRVTLYNNYTEIVKNHHIDAVIIATPTSAHYLISIYFLKNGIHTLVEKPLCLKLEEGMEMIRLAKRKKCILMVGHTFLYNNSVIKMKEIILDKSFGEIFYISAKRTHLGLIRPDVSVHWDLAPHDISIINYLVDAIPIEVQCNATKVVSKNKYDVAFISLYYPKNVLANIHVSWIDANKTREVAVVGQFKKIVFNDLSTEEPLKVYEKGIEIDRNSYTSFGEFKYLVREGNIESPKVHIVEPLKQQVNDFINSILENKKPRSNEKIGLDVVKVLEKVDESIKKGGTRVRITK